MLDQNLCFAFASCGHNFVYFPLMWILPGFSSFFISFLLFTNQFLFFLFIVFPYSSNIQCFLRTTNINYFQRFYAFVLFSRYKNSYVEFFVYLCVYVRVSLCACKCTWNNSLKSYEFRCNSYMWIDEYIGLHWKVPKLVSSGILYEWFQTYKKLAHSFLPHFLSFVNNWSPRKLIHPKRQSVGIKNALATQKTLSYLLKKAHKKRKKKSLTICSMGFTPENTSDQNRIYSQLRK